MADRDLLRADLDDYLGIEVPTGPVVYEPGAAVPLPDQVLPAPDENLANRLLYKLRRLGEEEAAVLALAREEVERIRAWESDRVSGIRGEAARVRRSLEGFLRRYVLTHPRTKTLSLSNGDLRLRAGRARVEVVDGEAFRRWVEENDPENELGLVRVTVEPALDVLAKLTAGPDVRQGDVLQSELLIHEPGSADEGPPTSALPGVRRYRPVEPSFSAVVTTPEPKEPA